MERLTAILRCPRCAAALERTARDLRCAACGARANAGGVVDLAGEPRAPRSLGARVMASRAMAAVYEAAWRPAAFALSTGFRMPKADDEAAIVLDRLAGCAGPWLDLSCGPGAMTRRLCAAARGELVVAVDLSAAMLDRAKRAAPDAALVRADALALPFVDGAFGAVVNLAALDLYPDAARAVREAARVLRRGGRWIASAFVVDDVVARDSKPHRALTAVTSIHLLGKRHLEAIARSAGLTAFASRSFGTYVIAWAEKA